MQNKEIDKVLSKLLGVTVTHHSGIRSHNGQHWPNQVGRQGTVWRADVSGSSLSICARYSGRLYIPINSDTTGETEHQGWSASHEGFAELCVYAFTRWMKGIEDFGKIAKRNEATSAFHADLMKEFSGDTAGGFSSYVAQGKGGRIIASQKSPKSVRLSIELTTLAADDVRLVRKLLAPFIEANAEEGPTQVDDAP